MRLIEIAQPKKSKLKTYEIRIRVPGLSGTSTNTKTIVVALNPQMARKVVQAQYNVPNIMIGQPREIKTT
jgi:mannose/fructose/N-acetylgalactosamine-specific phosphotransferase system component IIB